MSFQCLQTLPSFCIPNPAGFIIAGRNNFGPLRIERDLRDFPFVPDQYPEACPSINIIDSGIRVRRGGDQLGASRIESDIKYLVSVPPECFDALATHDVPQLAGVVNGPCGGVVRGEIELRTGDFSGVAFQDADALAGACIPNA